MKKILFRLFLPCLFLFVMGIPSLPGQGLPILREQGLPAVFPEAPANDVIGDNLQLKAARAFRLLQLPHNPGEWQQQRETLRKRIIESAHVSFYPDLPLEYNQTGSHRREGYEIRNIFFQTRPGVYATANLYIPDGEGPFPAAVVMMGHSRPGKLDEAYQSLGHSLALNGYVALNIDPWGAGERSTQHGEYDYHGSNLGASLMNVGETLMGVQITDNMRAIDLLCSLPFVDPANIGATGASGGGNQTMWLVAPRALKICSALHDANASFSPREMFRSFRGAQAVYRGYEADEMLSYQLFDTTHGYYPEMRESMLGWFDLHLKKQGTGAPKREKPFSPLPRSDLMVFPEGQRAEKVVSTEDFCVAQGIRLRAEMLARRDPDLRQKKAGLERILKIPEQNGLKRAHPLTASGEWERHILETASGGSMGRCPNSIRCRVRCYGWARPCRASGSASWRLSRIGWPLLSK